MRFVVFLVRRSGAEGYEVFICTGEGDLSTPAGRYSARLGKVVNEEEITDDFELLVRLRENSPLFSKVVRAYRDYVILQGREPLPEEATA